MEGNTSKFLSQIGLGGFDIGYLLIAVILLLILFIVVLVLLILQMKKFAKLNKRLEKLFTGRDTESLEDKINSLFEDNVFLKNSTDNNRKDIRDLYKRMESAYQKIGLVKYDAFNQMGGQLSFCLVLLDENNNGFVINSVHSTEGCYSYTKEIKQGESSISLGKEEAEALAIAMGEA